MQVCGEARVFCFIFFPPLLGGDNGGKYEYMVWGLDSIEFWRFPLTHSSVRFANNIQGFQWLGRQQYYDKHPAGLLSLHT